MDNKGLADLLHDLDYAKQQVAEVRLRMLVAVCDKGVDRMAAQKINLADWIDGYLVGQGVIQTWRIEEK